MASADHDQSRATESADAVTSESSAEKWNSTGIAFGIRLHFEPDYLRLSFAEGTSESVKSSAIADQLDAPSEAN